ncbi:YraN family protein [Skermania sp. ID1734]|uniref:YraN family protein n=1 Tax=Skermania sp. ID1734 TaxID=2597516 RepID=UPI00117C837D|nr:YraN family protein [Skermania sp. ID1734]TSE00144.1 YraN family protein [Skermania sp. ID1734]
MTHNLALGAHGEELAAQMLVAAGLDILCRNWRCRHGEIDLIARDGDTVVFVEVKTRRGTGFGTPAEAVTPAKQAKIRHLASAWLTERAGPWVPVRFDVVSVLISDGAEPVIEHLAGVF